MNTARFQEVAKGVLILGAVYFFIVGIGGMGHAFKLFGSEFADRVLTATSSPFVGLFIGILSTALVQSSSTTTSIIVGMVGGGAISVQGAVPMVMGANIGTSVTNTIVSLGHITRAAEFRRSFAAATVHDMFNLLCVVLLLPAELLSAWWFGTGVLAGCATFLSEIFADLGGLKAANPLKAATGPAIDLMSTLCRHHPIPVLVLSLLLTFSMLAALVRLLKSLVLSQVEAFMDVHLFRNAGRAMLFGMLFTFAVQSSSITTSLIVPLAAAGVLRLRQIFPYALGANVGTTMTAMLAAMTTGNPDAITVSFAHLLFNLFGIAIVWPNLTVRSLPIRAAEWLAERSVQNRLVPAAFILGVFFAVPLGLIILCR